MEQEKWKLAVLQAVLPEVNFMSVNRKPINPEAQNPQTSKP